MEKGAPTIFLLYVFFTLTLLLLLQSSASLRLSPLFPLPVSILLRLLSLQHQIFFLLLAVSTCLLLAVLLLLQQKKLLLRKRLLLLRGLSRNLLLLLLLFCNAVSTAASLASAKEKTLF